VFVVTSGRGVFTPVKVGVAGEQYFEVVDGLKAGDQVITGPFASVRELSDGGDVKVQQNNRDNRNRTSTSR
jgi:HlyD family secretion protein